MNTEQLLREYYTFDELRAFGCPDDLLMQYLGWTKAEVDRLLAIAGKGDE